MRIHPEDRTAFSLVELSIVLVILGLLVGGVLSGQSLIRAAELRKLTSQYQLYNNAALTFREKYLALPGDMTNATSFWGALSGCPYPPLPTAAQATCNGNGDGIVGGHINTLNAEVFGFWRQLANAGLIGGSYSNTSALGDSATTAYICRPLSAFPAANIPSQGSDGCISIITSVGYGFQGSTFSSTPPNANWFLYGDQIPNTYNVVPVINAVDTWNTDVKLDDGLPGYGLVQSTTMVTYNGSGTNCVTTSVAATALYNLSLTDKNCTVLFKPGF